MAKCRARPQWHSLCVRGLEVQSKHEAVQQLVRTALGHHWCNCGDEGGLRSRELLEFLGGARKDSEHWCVELNENLECQGRCKLPVSEREVAMPRASAEFVHNSKVPGLLWMTDHLHGSRNAEGVV